MTFKEALKKAQDLAHKTGNNHFVYRDEDENGEYFTVGLLIL